MNKVIVEVDTDIMNHMGFVISKEYIKRSAIEDIKQEIEQRMDGYEHITKDAVFAIIDKYREEQE